MPGTMLMGWVDEYLEEWVGGAGNLPEWNIRFLEPVWPDEQLTLDGEVTMTPADDKALQGHCRITAKTGEGRLVARITAEFYTTTGNIKIFKS